MQINRQWVQLPQRRESVTPLQFSPDNLIKRKKMIASRQLLRLHQEHVHCRFESYLPNTGNGKLAIHADAAYRQTDDLRIPGNPLRSSAIKSGSRLQNTNTDQQSGSVGMSATSDHGYAGLSIDSYKNDYGTGLFESGSAKRINMNQDRFTFAGEQRNLDGKLGFLSTLHGSMSYTDYKHDETKGSEVESTFKNKGWEAHIGGTHIPVSTALGQLKGA